jgi:sulfonate transport system substrate-binding protein
MATPRRTFISLMAGAVGLLGTSPAGAADLPSQLTLDWAYYNPVSLVLKEKGWLEDELRADGVSVRWVQSLGSNKALEFLNAGSIDLGSTAGAAALLARINGNPIKAIYLYSKPEWTALVTRPDTGIAKVEDLKGRSIAVTKGTDPYIFLLRALDKHGLSQKEVKLVLLQHDQGRLALERKDVDAWAGLDPMMASTEIERGNRLFYRDADANTYGTLLAREAFLAEQPELVGRVLAVYEKGRRWALDNKDELASILARAAKLPPEVAQRQIGERTDLTNARVGVAKETIVAAGQALQSAGIIKPEVDIEAEVGALIDDRFASQLAGGQ